MKIAVPWPVKINSQPRVKEALSLWEDRSLLLVCLVEPSVDPFLNRFQTTVLLRNSTDIGTKVPKCYIYDMVKSVRDIYPEEDWYGFCNSDCVPASNVLEGLSDYEALIFHRTDVPEWANRFNPLEQKQIPQELAMEIWQMKQQGMNEKKIVRTLNRSTIPPPPGLPEWTYASVRQLFIEQGYVFFWGQDMYLFRSDVVDKILDGELLEKDYIIGTGGFDPRLSRYLRENFKTTRVINKLYHKIHHSEWKIADPDYIHNGGDVEIAERWEHREVDFIKMLCENGQKTSIPKFIKFLFSQEYPDLAVELGIDE